MLWLSIRRSSRSINRSHLNLLWGVNDRLSPLLLPFFVAHGRDVESILDEVFSETVIFLLNRVLIDPGQEPNNGSAEEAQAARHVERILAGENRRFPTSSYDVWKHVGLEPFEN